MTKVLPNVRGRRGHSQRDAGKNGTLMLALQTEEGATSRGVQAPLEAGVRSGSLLPGPEPPEGAQAFRHLDGNPARPPGAPELQN